MTKSITRPILIVNALCLLTLIAFGRVLCQTGPQVGLENSGHEVARLGPSDSNAPSPLLAEGHPVNWWFVFKLNSKAFPGCGGTSTRTCPFGGKVRPYNNFGQQFVYASSIDSELHQGSNCAGDTKTDPIGATFDEVYNGKLNYVVWNDQFYDDPAISGCTKSCGSPWGHSKGLLAWDKNGEGLVMQVTTPSWPGAGNKSNPRKVDGNTLGCIVDNNVLVSQHFFALRLTKEDLVKVLLSLQNASVVTDPTNRQIVRNGGPSDIKALVIRLGYKSKLKSPRIDTLSSGVTLISKPSALHVPPWQMLSALLGGVSIRAATWWANPKIPSTDASTAIKCWDTSLGNSGPIEIATTGLWDGRSMGLVGGAGPDFNHAKIGVSTSGNKHYSFFGDMNQQGSISGPNCGSSQNGRGGLFYVVENAKLSESIANLIKGETAPQASFFSSEDVLNSTYANIR